MQWNRITVVKGPDNADYGCIISGEAIVQGSDGTVLQDDLKRQILALLNQGPGSFTGKFGEAVDKMAQTATEIKDLLSRGQSVPNTKYTDLNGYTKATAKGFSDWKSQITEVFGSDLTAALGASLASSIAATEQALQDGQACSQANNCTAAQLDALIQAKDKIKELKAELEEIQENLLAETAPPVEATIPTSADISSVKAARSNINGTASVLSEEKTFILSGGGRLTIKAGVNLETAPSGNWKINGEEVIFVGNKSSGAFKGFYKVSYLTSPTPSPCTQVAKIERLVNKKLFTECEEGYLDPEGIYEVEFDKVITFAPNIASIDLSQLNSLYGESGLKGKVFITNDVTPADFIQKVQNFVAPSGWAKIWLHQGADGWELKSESGGGILTLTKANLTAYNAKLNGPCYGTKNDISVDGLVKSLKNNDADNLLFGLHKGLDFLSSKINQAKIPEEYWNCTDPKYKATYAKVFTYVLAPLLAPISYFADDKLKDLFGPNAGAAEIVFAMQCGLYNGMISTVSGAVDAVSQITSLATCQGQASIWAKVEEARNYTNPPGCSAGTPGCETGMLAYAKDMGSQMATALSQSPCLVAEIGGEISFGVGLAFLTAGASATVSSNTYANFFFKGLNFMDKISETFDIGGRIFSAGLSIAGKTTKFAYRQGKAFFKGITLGDLPNQRSLPGMDGHNYTVHSEAPLVGNHNVKPLLDENGNLVLDENKQFGIGCAYPIVSSGRLYRPTKLLETEPVLYASLENTPNFAPVIKNSIFALPAAATGGCPNGGKTVALSNAVEAAWLVALKAKLRGLNFTDAQVSTFLNDFPSEATRRRFLNDELDAIVWKKFSGLDGAKAWVRKSEALFDRIKAKNLDEGQINQLFNMYKNFSTAKDFKGAGNYNGIDYNEFGFPIFESNTPGKSYYADIDMKGDDADYNLANAVLESKNIEILRLPRPPAQSNGSPILIKINGEWKGPYTWHHHEDAKTMMPVLQDIHNSTSHTGGRKTANGLESFFDSPQ